MFIEKNNSWRKKTAFHTRKKGYSDLGKQKKTEMESKRNTQIYFPYFDLWLNGESTFLHFGKECRGTWTRTQVSDDDDEMFYLSICHREREFYLILKERIAIAWGHKTGGFISGPKHATKFRIKDGLLQFQSPTDPTQPFRTVIPRHFFDSQYCLDYVMFADTPPEMQWDKYRVEFVEQLSYTLK